jgi:hypothetical protein
MIQRFNTYKRVNENTSQQFVEKLTATDIDLIYDENLYDDIESVEAVIKYEIDIQYKSFGIDSLNPRNCNLILYVTFNKNEESIEKVFNFTNVECDTTESKIPFHPDNIEVNLKENKIKVNF